LLGLVGLPRPAGHRLREQARPTDAHGHEHGRGARRLSQNTPLDSMSMNDDATMRWWADGERAVAGRIDGLPDDDLAAPSGLPDWSRAHVVGHLARNA